ncbi:MAG: carboxypeptidase-like regulatory domain-containing protein [Candidatus Nanopelagicales bacterium]|nr:carboxypeptidase-like regulatory domain-containing protein [Candidatus Nanopelagicales bacterium]
MSALPRQRRAHRLRLVGPLLAALLVGGIPAPAAATLVGELSGTVTGGGAPLPNVWVTLTPVSQTGEASGNPKRALTDGEGRYEFPEIYDRDVKIHVRAPLLGDLVDTWWPAAHTFAQAGIIGISDWPVTADVELPVGGSVTGRVVDSTTGTPVPFAQVSALVADSPQSGPVGIATPGQSPGAFALAGLPPVALKLRVRLPTDSAHLSVDPNEWSEGISVDGAQSTTGLTIGLRRGATIRGTVRDDAGTPVEGASVRIVGCMPNCPLIVTSDSSGAYRVTGVWPGPRLGVVAWKGDQLVRQWYPGRDNASLATDIAVDVGDELDGIDFALRRAAFLTVTVSAADSGAPLPGAIVLLVSTSDSFSRHFALRTGGRPGSMRLGPVTPGTYTLNVLPGSSNPGYTALGGGMERGTMSGQVIALGPEDDVEVAVALPRASGSAGAGSGAGLSAGAPTGTPDPAAPGDRSGCRGTGAGSGPLGATREPCASRWPGLAAGFLTPTGDSGSPW